MTSRCSMHEKTDPCAAVEAAEAVFVGGGNTFRPLKALNDLGVLEPLAARNLILVTHQVNITALTGIVPAAGEMIVLTPTADGDFRVAGRLGATAFSGN